MIRGFVALKNGEKEKFNTTSSDALSVTLTNKEYDFVNLGDIKVAKSEISYIKITEVIEEK